MTELEKDIDEAIKQLGIKNEIRKCEDTESSTIVAKAKEVFVEGNPRAWWLSLKQPSKKYYYQDTTCYLHITSLVPEENECWFIPEVEKEVMPVYDTYVKAIPQLLGELYYFEYYIINKNFNWILIENDHNEIIISGIQPKTPPND